MIYNKYVVYSQAGSDRFYGHPLVSGDKLCGAVWREVSDCRKERRYAPLSEVLEWNFRIFG